MRFAGGGLVGSLPSLNGLCSSSSLELESSLELSLARSLASSRKLSLSLSLSLSLELDIVALWCRSFLGALDVDGGKGKLIRWEAYLPSKVAAAARAGPG